MFSSCAQHDGDELIDFDVREVNARIQRVGSLGTIASAIGIRHALCALAPGTFGSLPGSKAATA